MSDNGETESWGAALASRRGVRQCSQPHRKDPLCMLHYAWPAAGRAEGCDRDCGHWNSDQLLGIGTWNCALKAG